MNNFRQYFIYYVIYFYIFILFLKGYYPANETGILFIGFLIFMVAAYTFIGKAIKDEFNLRIKNIHQQLTTGLIQNYNELNNIKYLHITLAHKSNILDLLSKFLTDTNKELVANNEKSQKNFLTYFADKQLEIADKQFLIIYQKFLDKGYLVSIYGMLMQMSTRLKVSKT